MGEKLKYMGWGALALAFLQMFYLIVLQETNLVSWKDSQIIGEFAMIYVLLGGGMTFCLISMAVCLMALAWPGICRLASKAIKGFLVALPFACAMFFILASMPNWATAEESGWVTVWNAQADTIVAKGVITKIDLEPDDALAAPDLVKVTVKETATKEKKDVFVPKSFAKEASVGDTVTVLMRFASEEKRENGNVLTHPVIIYRHEVTVINKRKG